MPTENDTVKAIPWSMKPLLLPSVAVQLALGGKAFESEAGDGITVEFEGARLALHMDDFGLVTEVARRLKSKYASIRVPKIVPQTVVLAMIVDAQRFCADMIFKPGCVRVLYYPVVSPGSAFYRCYLPALACSKGSKVIANVSANRVARESLEYDVIVIQIDHTDATASFARTLQQMGKKVVFEIDDAFDAMEPWHPQYAQYSRAFEQDRMRRLFKLADAVSVSTPALAERYAELNRRIEVIPNYIDVGGWPRATARLPDGLFRILWAGSPAHWGDLNVIANPLFQFVRQTKDARLVFFGDVPDLPDDIKARAEAHPFVPFGEYPIKLADLRVDVALAPLVDCPFNICKSPIKVMEYLSTGYPVIASDVGPYRIFEQGALLCTTDGGWLGSLQRMHDDPNLRANLVSEGRKLVAKFDVFENVEKLENFYCSLKETSHA
jgi:glycosyltransferase involved in cell wall biosynthesis